MFYRACLVMFFAAAVPGMLQAACKGKIGNGTITSDQMLYDPFNPSDTADKLKLSIRNTGDEACGYALAFRTPGGSAKLGKILTYFLTGLNGRPLLIDAMTKVPAASQLAAPVPVDGTDDFSYRVVIPRGQFAAPGYYVDTLTLELYALDSVGQVGSMPLDSTTLQLSYTVLQILSVNIKGAGTTTTVDFGELTMGKQKTVIIQARSNHSYDLNISSSNYGAMALTPPVPSQNWSVGYEARFNNRPLDLNKGTSMQKLPPTYGEEASHKLEVTVGDVARKRAGEYKDVITVQISPATP